jgi:hypothetical protein
MVTLMLRNLSALHLLSALLSTQHLSSSKQCIANRSVDSYFGLKQCIEQVAERGREIASRKQ